MPDRNAVYDPSTGQWINRVNLSPEQLTSLGDAGPGTAPGTKQLPAAPTTTGTVSVPTWDTPAPAALGNPSASVKPMEGDLDLSKKMVGETNFDERKDQYTQPGMAQPVVQDAIDKRKGAAPLPNNSAKMFGMWENLAPADMGAYYDNAGRQATEKIDRSAKARGTYGASSTNDLNAEALTNLAADRAKAEAGYGLQRTALGGTLASGADASALAGSADDRAWTMGLGGLAQGVDAGHLAGEVARGNAATSAENSGQNRINSLFGATLRGEGAQSDVIGDANKATFNNDKDLFGSGVAASVAPYSEGAAQAIAGRAQSDSDREATMKNTAALAKLFKESK